MHKRFIGYILLGTLISSPAFSQDQGEQPAPPVQAESPPPEASESPSAEVTSKVITKGKYITGGILGSAIGLGIGHYVQGRGSKGALFTATEAGSLVLMIGLVAGRVYSGFEDAKAGETENEKKDREKRNEDRAEDAVNSPGVTAARLLFVGMRVYEIVDIWTHPEQSGNGYIVRNTVVPMIFSSDQKLFAGLGVSYTFAD